MASHVRTICIAFIALFSVVTVSANITFKYCDTTSSHIGNVNEVTTDAEVKAGIVYLKRGTSVTVNFNFTMANGGADTVKSIVHGIIDNISIPFPIANPDGCKKSGLTCPLKKDSTNKYTSVISVKKIFPALRLVVKWELQFKDAEIFCVLMPAIIV